MNWGDGVVSSEQTGDATHSYSTAGTHTVKLTGTFPAILFDNTAPDRAKLQTIEQWGAISWESMYGTFGGDLDGRDVSNVTNMQQLFDGAESFNRDLNSWDVSNVTNMAYMFYHATAFNGNVKGWDVSNVTDMKQMFDGAGSFNGDVSQWNVSKVTNMAWMFNLASSFAGHDLSGWNVSSVTEHTDFSNGWGSGNSEPGWL